MKPFRYLLLFLVGCSADWSAQGAISIARDWNQQIILAIRVDLPNPPVQARNLFSLSACMYDVWAAYEPGAVGFLYRGKHTAADVAAARREAISYAAYRILKERYALSRAATNTLPALDAHMASLGYDTNNTSMDPSTPAGVGNLVYFTVSAWFINDGARQLHGYSDYPVEEGGYVYINPSLIVGTNLFTTVDVNRWQRLAIANATDQIGQPLGPIQNYLGVQWLRERPFSLARTNVGMPWIDPGPPPKLNGVGDQQFRDSAVETLRRSSELSPDESATIDISPGAYGNNTLGSNDGAGRPLNPFTGQPYAPNIVKLGDYARCLSEFWADGPNSETPPGHWNVVANDVSDTLGFQKRVGGEGPVVDDLQWDVKLYFALNAALHDAACAAWAIKRYYDGWRPIAAVRYMASKGQSTYSNTIAGTQYGQTYHKDGLPIITNLIEQVNNLTRQPGQRHAGHELNAIVVRTWGGQPDDITNSYSGVRWIRADLWMPYQRKTFVSPAFPGYVSGHSTYSRAAAELMTAITGSEYFPGGMGVYTCHSNSFLILEKGPSQDVQFQWATYYDAGDQVGLSRIWGGIHPSADDLPGRRAGSQAGKSAWALAKKYFDGSITNTPVVMALRKLNQEELEVKYETLRGFYYQLQSTHDLSHPFTNEPGGRILSYDTSLLHTNPASGAKYFRVQRSFADGPQ